MSLQRISDFAQIQGGIGTFLMHGMGRLAGLTSGSFHPGRLDERHRSE